MPAETSHDLNGTHQCPHPKCSTIISNRFAFCRAHWYRVPRELRDQIWKSYLDGNAGTRDHIDLIDRAAETFECQ